MKKDHVQYTIRNIPDRLDRRLREVATQFGKSLNELAVSALTKGVGLDAESPVHHDLDDLVGTWVHDEACDKALEEMDRVDEDLWR